MAETRGRRGHLNAFSDIRGGIAEHAVVGRERSSIMEACTYWNFHFSGRPRGRS